MNLTGKNIVITGGTAGIGRELVRRLHRENAVFVIARSAERLGRLAHEFPGVLTYRADLSDLADVEAAASAVNSDFDEIDVLINNAAIQYTPTFIENDFDHATIQAEITVNFTSVCVLTALLLPTMRLERETAIVNVNSGLGLVPKTNSAVYCATKAALNSFSHSLRYQLEGTHVRVFQAFMPLVDTAMTSGRGDEKLTPADAVSALLRGVERGIDDNDIGKVRLLRHLVRLAPGVARQIMKAA